LAARPGELLVNTSPAAADTPLLFIEQRDIVMHVIELSLNAHCARSQGRR
jgi:hypothetical protein